MNMTKLLMDVNQAEAIRRGFNANSTVRLEIDVGMLSQPVREFIAARFDRGWLKSDPAFVGNDLVHEHNFTITRPDEEGLREAIMLAFFESGEKFAWFANEVKEETP